MKKYIMLLTVATALLGSCQSDEEFEVRHEVRVAPVCPTSVRSRITNNQFDVNDQIGFYMVEQVAGENPGLQYSGNYANNIKATYNGSSWTCAPKVFWEKGTYDFYAYYPFTSSLNSIDEYNFQVQLDQSGQGYNQSDFLWTKSTSVQATESAIPLKFAHKLSRIKIEFAKSKDYTGDLPENADVYIHNTNPNAIIDLSTGDVTCNNRLPVKTIKARHISGVQYEAVIIPQRLNNRVPMIEAIVNNVSYLIESRFVFTSGMSHTYKIILSDNPEQVKIEIGGGIENWN